MSQQPITDSAGQWSSRYQQAQTGWDIGAANVGLLRELTSRYAPSARILIPGAGRGHEAIWLWEHGYSQVYVCDWAPEAFATLRDCASLPAPDRLIVADFFALEGEFDALLEQTFFCAIPPAQRAAYVEQAFACLAPGGRLIGVLFDREFEGGPPYGGNAEAYRADFAAKFDQVELAPFADSSAPRRGSELLLVAQKIERTKVPVYL